MNLSERMLLAAVTLEEVSLLYGYPYPERVTWAAQDLRKEAAHVAAAEAQA